MAEQKIYGRVIDGKIVEYPVYLLHITNRAHPLDWYTPVLFSQQPDVDAFHYTRGVPSLSLDGSAIEVHYTVEPYTLDALMDRLPRPEGEETTMPVMPGREYETPTPELLAKIRELTLIRVEEDMDIFAQTRNYNNIASACSYSNSTIPKFAAEGTYFIELRDKTWMALYVYLAEIEAGTKPLPVRYSQIAEVLPVPAWPE